MTQYTLLIDELFDELLDAKDHQKETVMQGITVLMTEFATIVKN